MYGVFKKTCLDWIPFWIFCCSVAKLSPTLCDPMHCYLCPPPFPRLLCPWVSLGKNAGVGCHFLLHGILQTRDQTHVSCIGRRILKQWSPHPVYHQLITSESGNCRWKVMSHVPSLVNEGRRKNIVTWLRKLLLQYPPAELELSVSNGTCGGVGVQCIGGVRHLAAACFSYMQSSRGIIHHSVYLLSACCCQGLLDKDSTQLSIFARLPPTLHQTLPSFLNRETWAMMPFPQFKTHLFYILRNTSRVFVFYLAPSLDFLGWNRFSYF